MSYNHKYKKGEYVQTQKEQTETVKDVLSFPFMDLPDRKIRKETCERFGVRVGLSPEDGKTICAVYFPSLNQKGKIVGYMRADLTKNKEDKGYWTAVGSVTISNKLFGQDVAESIQRKRNNLVITEGPWDMLSVAQAQVDSVANTKYKGMEPFVVSIPLGTKNAVEAVYHNKQFVLGYDALTIFFDDDFCTPGDTLKGVVKGHEARDAVAGALIDSDIDIYTIQTQDGFKDASDYVQADMSAELARLVQFERKPFTADKIISAKDIDFEEFISPRPEGILIKEFPKLNEKLHGFRTHEANLLLAPSSVGKSTVSAIFAGNFIDAGERVGAIYLEEQKNETLGRMVARNLHVNYLRFKDNPLSVASKEDIKAAYDNIVKDDKLFIVDHFGSLTLDALVEKIKYLHFVVGCRYIILDHLGLIMSKDKAVDERKALDYAMTELASFAAANDVCLIMVCHINRSLAEQFKPPKGEDAEKPYWVKVTKESARGSAALEQLSFAILGLEPEINPDRTRGRTRIVVLKNRIWSSLGEADVFTLDNETWDVVLSEDNSF